MNATDIVWDHRPGRNVDHIRDRHALTPEEVTYALVNAVRHDRSRSSGLPAVFGPTPDGRTLFVVFKPVGDGSRVYPVTAYPVP